MTIHLLSAQLSSLVPALAAEIPENRVQVIEQTLKAAGYVVGERTEPPAPEVTLLTLEGQAT